MQLRNVHGICLSLVLSCMVHKGDFFRLNLTDVVQRYIQRLNATKGGKISSWGYTPEYWHQKRPSRKSPVTAGVSWMIYGDCYPRMYTGARKIHCTGHFSWALHEGIHCPFDLKRKVSLPVRYPGLAAEMFELDLNRLPATSVHKTWNRPSVKMEEKVFAPKCSFVAKVLFKGNIAYKGPKAGWWSSGWVTTSITSVANSTEGLLVEGGFLTYYVWGRYHEVMWCY